MRSALVLSRLALASVAAALLGACAEETAPEPATQERFATSGGFTPREVRDEGYVGAQRCAECHEHNHTTWYASYHRRMTQAASPATVLAPFEGRTPFEGVAAWELEREGEDFFATPTSADGQRRGERMRVALTTGSHHYQLYWLENQEPGGLLGLPFAWHPGDGAWLPRRSLFLTPPHLDSAYEFNRWQAVCIQCHTTNGTAQPTPSEAPRVAEFGIACEACHGPGQAHVDLHVARADTGTLQPVRDQRIVNPSELDHERSAMVCGQCHGIHPFASPADRERWRVEGFAYRPGDDLALTRTLLRGVPAENSAALREAVPTENLAQLFWSDGEVRVSGREYNGLVESPCFQRGELDCLSCHRMHASPLDERPLATWADDQLRQGMRGDSACTSCHAEYRDAARTAAHTHHAARSTGSECMNCHMPHTTYGLTKAIRSHTITSPNAATSRATGRPNACNLCHLDRPLGWTADRLAEWYDHDRPALEADEEQVSAIVRAALTGDAGQRALAAWTLGWEPAREVAGTSWMPYLLGTLLADPYDAVARVAQLTVRRTSAEVGHAALSLPFELAPAERAAQFREHFLPAWLQAEHSATPEQSAAVLVGADGTLDQARVRALLLLRDQRDVRLAE